MITTVHKDFWDDIISNQCLSDIEPLLVFVVLAQKGTVMMKLA